LKSDEDGKAYTCNGIQAFKADILVIEFRKKNFDRNGNGPLDPPEGLIKNTINSFLIRLRSITNSFQVSTIDFPRVTWEIKYLDDDGNELEKDERFIRFRGVHEGHFSWTAMNLEIWERIHGLPPDYLIPQWQDLILEAYSAFPKIGPAVVLAFTALEVFIGQILDRLVEHSKIAPDLWKWINDRKNDPAKWPDTEEQYGELLRILTGKSLKENKILWEGFKSLRKARNSFAHEGVAISLQDKKPLLEEEGKQLVDTAWKIILFVRDSLPDDLKWPNDKPKTTIEHTFKTRIRGIKPQQ
jgi:hypothetical protein